MDAYRSRGVPPHLVTDEFNRLVLERLSHNGLFLSNVIDRVLGPHLAASVALTLTQTFPAVELWVPDGPGAQGLTNIVVAARRKPDDRHPGGDAYSRVHDCSGWRSGEFHPIELAPDPISATSSARSRSSAQRH